MARLGRYFVRHQPLHVIQRGIAGRRIFFAEADYTRYRDWLGAAAADYGCAIHAYVLMPNHVHLLLTPAKAESLPRLMQSLGRRYVRFINDKRAARGQPRSGTLWDGRYRAAPIEAGAFLLRCMRYIELNPVRAGIAARLRDYEWSSYRAHALGAGDPILREHEIYRALRRAPAARQKAYRGLFRDALDRAFLDALRAATNGGWALGDEAFRRRIARAAGRRAAPKPPGRPTKRAAGKRRK